MGAHMDRKTFRFLSVILFASLGVGAAVLAFNTHPGRFAALGLYAALVLLFVYINSRCFKGETFVPARRYLLFLAMALSAGIQLFDATPYAGSRSSGTVTAIICCREYSC